MDKGAAVSLKIDTMFFQRDNKVRSRKQRVFTTVYHSQEKWYESFQNEPEASKLLHNMHQFLSDHPGPDQGGCSIMAVDSLEAH